MLISIETDLAYQTTGPYRLLLQIEAVQNAHQISVSSELDLPSEDGKHTITGEEGIGLRRWVSGEGTFDCRYRATVRVDRPIVSLEDLSATPLDRLPSEAIKFLMPSRYCHPEDFVDLEPQGFQDLSGGPLIFAMSRWIKEAFTYDNDASTAATTATQSYSKRAGVCRDYAHVLISMARAVGVPARFVSVYAPDVVPQDFHAVVEVYLDGHWHLIDPTGMAHPSEMVVIGLGRDAADVSFMTSYGWMELKKQTVAVSRALE